MNKSVYAALAALGLLVLVACPPERNTEDPPPTPSDVALWMVISQIQGDSTWVSHSFIEVNLGSYCAATQNFYEAYSVANAQYYEDRRTIQEKFGYDGYGVEYNRAMCELQRDLYLGVADEAAFMGAGREVFAFTVNHPDAEDYGAPVPATYELQDDDYYYYYDDDDYVGRGGGAQYFSGNKSFVTGNVYEAYATIYDCDSITEENPYIDYGEFPDVTDDWSVTAGTLDVAQDGSNWKLTLNDGVLTQEETEETTSAALDRTFVRCNVTFETPSYDYYEYPGR